MPRSLNHESQQEPIAPCKGIQDSLGSWIQRCGFGFRVLDSDSLSVELEFWIPIVSGFRIPWAVFQIPKPKIPDSTSKSFPKNFPDPGIQIPLHGAKQMGVYEANGCIRLPLWAMKGTTELREKPLLAWDKNTLHAKQRPLKLTRSWGCIFDPETSKS